MNSNLFSSWMLDIRSYSQWLRKKAWLSDCYSCKKTVIKPTLPLCFTCTYLPFQREGLHLIWILSRLKSGSLAFCLSDWDAGVSLTDWIHKWSQPTPQMERKISFGATFTSFKMLLYFFFFFFKIHLLYRLCLFHLLRQHELIQEGKLARLLLGCVIAITLQPLPPLRSLTAATSARRRSTWSSTSRCTSPHTTRLTSPAPSATRSSPVLRASNPTSCCTRKRRWARLLRFAFNAKLDWLLFLSALLFAEPHLRGVRRRVRPPEPALAAHGGAPEGAFGH